MSAALRVPLPDRGVSVSVRGSLPGIARGGGAQRLATREGSAVDALVSTAWLEAALGAPDLRVLHCTVRLRPRPEGPGYRVESARPEWETGHVPESAHVELASELSDPGSPLPFTLPTAERFARAMEAAGVGEGTRVVLYDAMANIWAARLWWMLRAFGFDEAAVLDGGWRAWSAEGRPTSTGPAPRWPQARFRPRPRPGLFTDREEVRAAVEGRASLRLVDALGEAQYRGESETYGRRGHIPGARNLPASSLVDPETQRYRPLESLRAAVAGVAPEPSERVVAYCGGGIAASSDAFTLHRLGYRDVAVYDGSLSEWAAEPSLPMETGEGPGAGGS